MIDSSAVVDDIASLRLQKRLYDQASRLAGLGGWQCDLRTERLTWTEGVYDLFGLPVGLPVRRAAIVAMYVDESRHAVEVTRAETIRTGRPFRLESQIRTSFGQSRWIRLTGEVAYEDGRPVRLFGAKQDVTAERDAWSRLRRTAEHDALTGLPNRGLFDARYRDVVGDTLNHGFVSALALIDIDRFKPINDKFGHAAGDECLQEFARRLDRAFKDATLVARIGGDEFAVMLPATLDADAVAGLLRKASRQLCQPFLWNGVPIDLRASIGAAILGRPLRRRLSDLFADADAALYIAKASGRDAVHIFEAESGPERGTCAAAEWDAERPGKGAPRPRYRR